MWSQQWSQQWSQRWSHRRQLSLAGRFLVLQLAVVAVVLGVVAVISLRQSTATFEDERGSQLRAVAEYVANIAVVREVVDDPNPASSLAPSVDRALSLSGADDVLIASPDGVVLSSSDPTMQRKPAALGDSVVRQGRGWTGSLDVDGRHVVAGHAPILADDGRLVGLAIAQEEYPSVWERLTDAAPDLALFLGLGAALGLGGSLLLSRSFKRSTRGLRAEEIATLADHREALLHSIREGVVAVSPDGRVSVLNDSAQALLGLTDDAVGRPVADLGLDRQVAELLTSSDEARDTVLLVGDRVLVFNQRIASSKGEGIGSVTTMRDRTELVAMQNQLDSNLSITDTLRAQTHEFANQLHTISGLVQLEEYDEVRTLIGDLTRRRSELTEFVVKRVEDTALAALLVAKSSVADEAGVRLTLTPDSRLGALPSDLSSDLITIVGNLVDNAVDACRHVDSPEVSVRLEQADEVVVQVRDNGSGIPAAMREQVFERGFSTKPAQIGGRGIGLPLVRLLCTRRGGDVRVDRVDGQTVFVVTLPVVAVP